MKASKALKRLAKIKTLLFGCDGAIFKRCGRGTKSASRRKGCSCAGEGGGKFAGIFQAGEESHSEDEEGRC